MLAVMSSFQAIAWFCTCFCCIPLYKTPNPDAIKGAGVLIVQMEPGSPKTVERAKMKKSQAFPYQLSNDNKALFGAK